jgi:hypothetical protein
MSFNVKISLAEMKKRNIARWTVVEIMQSMPVLLEWAEQCVVESHIKERREYLLRVLAEKQATLAQSLDYVTRNLDEVKEKLDGLNESYKRTFPILVSALEAKRFVFESDENLIIRAMKAIEKQMIIVGKLLDPEEMEPSIFDEAADRGPEEPMSLNQ